MFWQQELSEAGDRAKAMYYASHSEEERTTIGVATAIRQEIELQKKKIRSGFIKQLKIADTNLGEEFLNQIRLHWNKTQNPEMTQEKLYRLCGAMVDGNQKVQWLKCWNGSPYLRATSGIPPAPFSDSTFDTWLHKATFWSQVLPCLLSTSKLFNVVLRNSLIFILIVQLEKKAVEVLQETYVDFNITMNEVPVMPDALDIYMGKWKSTAWKNGFFREFGVKDGIKRSLEFEDQYNSALILKRTIFRC